MGVGNRLGCWQVVFSARLVAGPDALEVCMALDIKWERPDQRLRMAVTAPLFLDIAGERLRATEWSLDHIRITGAWQPA